MGRATTEEVAKIDQLIALTVPLDIWIKDYWAKLVTKGRSATTADAPGPTLDQDLSRPGGEKQGIGIASRRHRIHPPSGTDGGSSQTGIEQ